MEELQSTEVLDREILEDARKKAYRILKTAEDTVASGREVWEKKTQETLEGARKSCKDRLEKNRLEIMARLPMDKRRIRSEKVETLLQSAMKQYLSSLKRERLLLLLENELRERIGETEDLKDSPSTEVRYRELTDGEVEGLLKKFPSLARLKTKKDPLYILPGDFPALVIDFPDLRLTASVDAAARSLLLDQRAELVSSLLGPEILSETTEAADA
ncbi:hypothetical protein FACS189468_2630 [Spirochaetia bacterium]|nr:hypothetical protein FACS189468_2630 [Spirochaetia bacterium]